MASKLIFQSCSEPDAAAWAKKLIELHDTNLIFTPVEIEFIAGARNRDELKRYRAFLAEFLILDERHILKSDWEKARQLAQRVPGSGRKQNMGDCLIRAIGERLNCEILTLDTGFPG